MGRFYLQMWRFAGEEICLHGRIFQRVSGRGDFAGAGRGFCQRGDFAGGKPKKKGVPKLIEFALLPLWNQRNTDGLFLISRKHNFLYKIAQWCYMK